MTGGPIRVQLRRTKGWRMPPNTVKVDRTTKWGNPFKVGEDGTARDCVELFAIMLQRGLLLTAKATPELQIKSYEVVNACLHELRGKNLACWCKPDAPCHADVLLALANRDHSSDAGRIGEQAAHEALACQNKGTTQ
jgi:hypothetical protein